MTVSHEPNNIALKKWYYLIGNQNQILILNKNLGYLYKKINPLFWGEKFFFWIKVTSIKKFRFLLNFIIRKPASKNIGSHTLKI